MAPTVVIGTQQRSFGLSLYAGVTELTANVNCGQPPVTSVDGGLWDQALNVAHSLMRRNVRAFHELQGVMTTLMRNGRDRRSENPRWVTRGKSAWF
jgi:hypothetical protein